MAFIQIKLLNSQTMHDFRIKHVICVIAITTFKILYYLIFKWLSWVKFRFKTRHLKIRIFFKSNRIKTTLCHLMHTIFLLSLENFFFKYPIKVFIKVYKVTYKLLNKIKLNEKFCRQCKKILWYHIIKYFWALDLYPLYSISI